MCIRDRSRTVCAESRRPAGLTGSLRGLLDVLRSSDRSKLFLPGLIGSQDRHFFASSQCSDQFKTPEKVPSRVADLEFSSRGHLLANFFKVFFLAGTEGIVRVPVHIFL